MNTYYDILCLEPGASQTEFKKAYFACEKAYELGCRDNDFLLTYAMECNEYGEYDKGIQILFEIVRSDRKWSKEDIPELAVMLSRICVGSSNDEDGYQAVERAFHLMYEAGNTQTDKEVIRVAKEEFDYQRIVQDERIGGTLEAAYEVYFNLVEIDTQTRKIGRNDPCLCGLGKKYKHCCMK